MSNYRLAVRKLKVMAEGNKKDKTSFWATIPGILTGIAALITAITGLLIGLNQNDMGKKNVAPNQTDHQKPASLLTPGSVSATESLRPDNMAPDHSAVEPMASIQAIDGNITKITERSLKFRMDNYIALENGQKVQFQKLKAIEVLGLEDARAKVRLTLLDGSSAIGYRDISGAPSVFEGESQLGKFAIDMRKVKLVSFPR